MQDFKLELTMLISRILKNATGTSSKSPFSIYKYPEEVKQEIVIMQTKNEMLKAEEEKARLLSLC